MIQIDLNGLDITTGKLPSQLVCMIFVSQCFVFDELSLKCHTQARIKQYILLVSILLCRHLYSTIFDFIASEAKVYCHVF